MKKGIIGKKIGMTQIFDEKGNVIPVTVIEAGPCVVAQVKTHSSVLFVSYIKAQNMHDNLGISVHFIKLTAWSLPWHTPPKFPPILSCTVATFGFNA